MKLRHQKKQWNDYNGKYRGKLLTPMEYQQYGNKGDFVMSNRIYYKQFCQFDHMKRDKDFMHYLLKFVTTNPRTGKGIGQNFIVEDLYTKLKYITLNDYFDNKFEQREKSDYKSDGFKKDYDNIRICCVKSGNSLTEWELLQVQHTLKDYNYFNKNKEFILEEWEEEDWEEMEDEESIQYYHNPPLTDDELPF